MITSSVASLAFNLVGLGQKVIRRFSLVGPGPFFGRTEFPWVANLEANWHIIRSELDEVLKHRDRIPNIQDITPEVNHFTQSDNWKSFWLHGYGYKSEANCRRCPKTAEILAKIPGMKTAFFSILRPRKQITAHHGDYNGVMRILLGLKIPNDRENCWIEVGGQRASWKEGEAMMFDDTYEHQVWNNTDEERIVLFIDFMRPLPFPISLMNHALLRLIGWTPYVQVAKKNQEKWEQSQDKEFQHDIQTSAVGAER